MRAPGPARLFPQGPIYDQALGVLAEVTGELGKDFAAQNQRLIAANQSVEANRRVVDFSLGLDDVLSRAQNLMVTENGVERLADPDEQEGFFRQNAEELLHRYADYPKADIGLQAELRNKLVRETADKLMGLRKVQLHRQMQTIADTAQAGVDKAYLSGSRALFDEYLDDMVEVGVISEGKRDELAENFPIESALSQAFFMLTDAQGGRADEASQMLNEILADQNITQEQRTRAAQLLNIADANSKEERLKAKATLEYAQEQTKRGFVGKLANLKDPTKDQLTVGEILQSNLDAADQLQYIKLISTWSEDTFKDKPQVMADVLYRRQQGTITDKDIWGLVGEGVSPATANQLTDPTSFYSDPGFRQADEFIKRNLGYQNELIGWINPQAARWYDQAKNDLIARIEREELKGDAIRKAGYEVAIPHLIKYWQEVMSMTPEQLREAEQQVRALSGTAGAPSSRAPKVQPQKTEEQKVREIFGIN